ncbi:DUF6599 family protein [Terracidiphilus sp.]|jgi:hypothetical protein|uniref:DUF6599 family protein n=1 Tax=Terracidiphilus sp. TaxID=1964191 RepID=UPI003C16E296
MRLFAILVCAATLTVAQAQAAAPKAQPAPQAAAQSPEKPLLPSAFDGWVASEAPKNVSDPAQIDSANAAALKEYGFESGMTATYKRDDETLAVKALRFPDVSGSFGAYGFYRDAKWPKEQIGSGAVSNGNHVIFWRGAIVIDATFSKVHPESASELRELADTLPTPAGNKALPPPILSLLPKSDREDQTAHYVKGPDGFALIPSKGLEGLSPHYTLGPAGYTGSGGVLPASLIGFDRDAEAVTASYALSSGPATLTLISYPTAQIATAAEAQIRAYIQSGGKGQTPFTKPLQDSDQASLEVRRTGPIVAFVSGDAIPDDSHKLVQSVHYSSDLTRMPMPGISDVAKTSSLLYNIAMFVMVVGGAAVLLGLFLGGGRAIYRIARGKPASSMYEAEFTSLHLRE